jgi:hypothetical protein
MPWSEFADAFTHKFWDDHVYEGDDIQAKRSAEEIFLRRDKSNSASTLLLMPRHAVRILADEVRHRQAEFRADYDKYRAAVDAGLKPLPIPPYQSQGAFAYLRRDQGTKRAYTGGPARFQYSVQKGPDERFRIHHFAGTED